MTTDRLVLLSSGSVRRAGLRRSTGPRSRVPESIRGLTFILIAVLGALLLFPVAYIALGVAFLQPEESLEFV